MSESELELKLKLKLELDPADRRLLQAIRALIEEVKGEETVTLDVRSYPVPASFLVITTADNPKQMRALVEHLEERLDRPPERREGGGDGRWTVLDYGPVLVHVLRREARAFYDLEGLWGEHPVDLEVEAGSSSTLNR